VVVSLDKRRLIDISYPSEMLLELKPGIVHEEDDGREVK